jgi:hypothetical protein
VPLSHCPVVSTARGSKEIHGVRLERLQQLARLPDDSPGLSRQCRGIVAQRPKGKLHRHNPVGHFCQSCFYNLGLIHPGSAVAKIEDIARTSL